MEAKMIYNIPEPELSPNFTIDDIHVIREWNYERMKDASKSEIVAYYKQVSALAQAERKALKN
jgi:hypothetical protein